MPKKDNQKKLKENLEQSGFRVIRPLKFNSGRQIFEGVVQDGRNKQLKIEISGNQIKLTFLDGDLAGKSFSLLIPELLKAPRADTGGIDAEETYKKKAEEMGIEHGIATLKTGAVPEAVQGARHMPSTRISKRVRRRAPGAIEHHPTEIFPQEKVATQVPKIPEKAKLGGLGESPKPSAGPLAEKAKTERAVATSAAGAKPAEAKHAAAETAAEAQAEGKKEKTPREAKEETVRRKKRAQMAKVAGAIPGSEPEPEPKAASMAKKAAYAALGIGGAGFGGIIGYTVLFS